MATATERVRNFRDRKRRGVEVVSIEVDGLVIGSLTWKDYLSMDALGDDYLTVIDKAAVAKAIEAKLNEWSQEVGEEYEAAEARGET